MILIVISGSLFCAKSPFSGKTHIYEGHTDTFDVLKPKKDQGVDPLDIMDLYRLDILTSIS